MSEAGDALRQMADRADGPGGRAAAEAMASTAQDEIKRKLSQRSHARGTPTPSPPGQPPARISGRLEGSVVATTPTGGGGVWTAYTGPKGVVYAAIQQYGGVAGRGHHSVLPPRPYMDVGPVMTRISDASASAFYRATWG